MVFIPAYPPTLRHALGSAGPASKPTYAEESSSKPYEPKQFAASCSKPSDFQGATSKLQQAQSYPLIAVGGGARSATAAEGLCLSMRRQALGSAGTHK